MLELATADTADSEDYQAVLLQRGTADSYESFIEDSEADLKQPTASSTPQGQPDRGGRRRVLGKRRAL